MQGQCAKITSINNLNAIERLDLRQGPVLSSALFKYLLIISRGIGMAATRQSVAAIFLFSI